MDEKDQYPPQTVPADENQFESEPEESPPVADTPPQPIPPESTAEINPDVSAEPPNTLAAPEENSNLRIRILLAITGILILVLGGTIWYFFIRPQTTTRPRTQTIPTPTSSSVAIISPSPTPEDQEETHLECRFGLCVKVPGAGEDLCASSFDCEQITSIPTPTGEELATTPTAAPPASPSPTSGIGLPVATATPTPIPTATPTPTLTPTPIVNQLPESGAIENTLFFTLIVLFSFGLGWALINRTV